MRQAQAPEHRPAEAAAAAGFVSKVSRLPACARLCARKCHGTGGAYSVCPKIVLPISWVKNMQVHIFRGPGRIFGFTAESSGENLPSKYAPWTTFKTVEMRKDEKLPGVDVDDCLRDLEAHGVHITDAHIRITEEAIQSRLDR